MHEMHTGGTRKWHVGWGYSARCNMACSFCYSKLPRSTFNEKHSSPEQAMQFLRRNEQSIDSINWGTGENTLCEAWWELVREIHETYPDIRQSLTTNGSLVLHSACDAKGSARVMQCLNDIDVSIDFADPARHNALRGHDRAFQMAVSCLELARACNVPRSVVMLGIEETLEPDALDVLFELAATHGANVRINIYRPVPGLKLMPPPYETVRNALVHIISRYRVVALSDPLFGALFGRSAPDPSGVSSCRILPDGGVTPSTYLVTTKWIAANLSDISDMTELLTTAPFRVLQASSVPDRCRNCSFASSCGGGAKDRRILQGGSLTRPDPYCPFENNDSALVERAPRPTYSELGVSLVHVGYLPTLVFAP